MTALKQELRANVYMLQQKRDIIEKTIRNLGADEFLPGLHTRFLTDVYDAHYGSITPHLTEKERASLHLLYEYFRRIDLTLESFTNDFIVSLGTERVHIYMELYKGMLADMVKLIDLATELGKSHLAGTPKDVLHMEVEIDSIHRLRFTRDPGNDIDGDAA